MKPIIYSSEDAGAPKIFRTVNSINAVIKACLVTGYSGKLAAGWELLDEDSTANTLTLRSKNPTSVANVFVLEDSNINTGITISGFLSWDTTLSKPVSEYGKRFGLANRSVDSRPPSNAQKWVLIADDKFCWFFLSSVESGGYGVLQAFGDLIDIKGDNPASGVIGYDSFTNDWNTIRINTIQTSQGIAYIAKQPYPTRYVTSLGGTAEPTDPYISDTFVLSKQVVYLKNSANIKEPAFFIPGLLVSSAEIPYTPPVDGTSRLNIGDGLSEPIALLRQSYPGYVPISMDEWG